MKVIRHAADLSSVSDPALRGLIDQRIEALREYVEVFSDLVYFIVVEPGDAISEIDEALGFPVLWNRFTDVPYGDPAFSPSWDVLDEHPGYYELVFVLTDDGAGVTMFISKGEGINPQLKEMCMRYLNPTVNSP